MEQRLFIISNRLPLSVDSSSAGEVQVRQSSGGLVSAVNAYLARSGGGAFAGRYWCGVSECSRRTWQHAVQNDKSDGGYNYLPLFIDKKRYDHYYGGFSNSILWPLFHYFPSFAEYNPAYFDAYKEVNEAFADELVRHLRPGDVVWIHDYHLLLLPAMLRSRCPGVTIGFFLHIPFPSFELFRMLPKPWQHGIITGMLGADLVGFHTRDYAAHFAATVQELLHIPINGNIVMHDGRPVRVDAFPIGIDFRQFHEAYDQPAVAEARAKYNRLKGERKLIFSVDRLDYTKGVSHRLRGYEHFLEACPEYKERVVFVLNIVPSRDSITKYAERKRIIDEYIGNLNSRLGSITWQPVIYQYNHLPFDELVALYTACDIALITPLRDGMNLVAKEFVASRRDKSGVLILSELAGAARELNDALLINPNDKHEIAQMLKCAMEMTPAEQEQRMEAMQATVRKYDVSNWAADFFARLYHTLPARPLNYAKLLQRYRAADRRLIVLDYDGTLAPFAIEPGSAKPSAEVLEILRRMLTDERNDVYIVSGRDAATLERWLGHLRIGLVAEHGMKHRQPGGVWKVATGGHIEWMEEVEEAMSAYAGLCPGSFVERKEFSVAWHYRAADEQNAGMGLAALQRQLLPHTASGGLQLLPGNKILEMRTAGTDKGVAVKQLLNNTTYDFVLCAGDDRTDEDMFQVLKGHANACTVKVGGGASCAQYAIDSVAALLVLLGKMSAVHADDAVTGSHHRVEA